MAKLNKKEYKLFNAFWLVTIILAIFVGLSFANRIKHSSGTVAGWATPYCVKCEEINPQTAKSFFSNNKDLGKCKVCGKRLTSRSNRFMKSFTFALFAPPVLFLIYGAFIRSAKPVENEAYTSDAKFTCPYCSQRVEVPNSLFGEMISCPTCEKDFRASGIAERDGGTVTV
jgi:transcription elongation factor Elf1